MTTAVHPWVAAGERQIRCGVFVAADWDKTVELAQLAETLGFDSFWMSDHPVVHGRDCWTYLAALARATRRIRLGSLVTCIYFRHPVLLARIVADVDRISGGRVVLGLGIGDMAREFAQLGLALPPVGDRLKALEEAVQILSGLFAGQDVTFDGAHFRATAAALRPGPVQQPRIPLLIAGGGERVTLRQAAQYADASNFGPGEATGSAWTVEDVRRKCDALASHCAAQGRPVESVLRTYFCLPGTLGDGVKPGQRRHVSRAGLEYLVFDGTPDDAVAHYRTLEDAGVRYFIFAAGGAERMRLLAEGVLPRLGGGIA